VAQDDYFRNGNTELLSRDSGTSGSETVEDAMKVAVVLPEKEPNAWIVGKGPEFAFLVFIASRRAFDCTVIHKWPSSMRDLQLQNEGDVFMEDGDGIGPTLRQDC
jgi:hypothetical protein